MKGLKLCSGLLLASFITFGAFFAGSSDVSAKKYSVDTIPLYFPAYTRFNPPTEYGFQLIYSGDADFSARKSKVYNSVIRDNKCVTDLVWDMPYINYNYSTIDNRSFNRATFAIPGIKNFPSNFSGFSNAQIECYDINGVPSDFDHYSYIPADDNLVWSQDYDPFRFLYSGFYAKDTFKTDGGIYVDSKFDLIYSLFWSPDSSFRGTVPSYIKEVYIPIGTPDSEILDTFEEDMPIEFTGEIIFDFQNPNLVSAYANPTDLSNNSFLLETTMIESTGSYRRDTDSCSVSITPFDPDGSGSYIYSMKYRCRQFYSSGSDGSLSNVFPYYRLIIKLSDFYQTEPGVSESEADYTLRTFFFDSSFSITNDDYSDGGNWGESVTGKEPGSAPGSADQWGDLTEHEPDFFDSLTSMFNFSFVNPFQGIFDLFGSSSCVSIPTIASMLHSQESTVCPWFPSEVRSIVTPVLGLSSMMLLFGFTVRWLGARSGNFIEDSGGIDSGGYHFQNKFRRKS